MASVQLTENLHYGIHPGIVPPNFHVDHFVGLCQPKEKIDIKFPNYHSGKTIKNFPIKDRTAPSQTLLTIIVDYINSLSGVVYIFCKGGHGRSGTIAAAVYGQQQKLTGKQSLEKINKEWHTQRDLTKIGPKVKKLGSPQNMFQKLTVIQYLDKPTINTIPFYDPENPHGWYSNFYKISNLIINDEKWIDTESYFQAMKFRGDKETPRSIEYSNLIKIADSPMKVKMLGTQKKNTFRGTKWVLNKQTDRRNVNQLIDEYKDIKIRPDWDEKRIEIMIDGVSNKFIQNPELFIKIKNSPPNSYFVEHTPRDIIWGDGGDGGDGTKGRNYLGKILTSLAYVLKYGNCNTMPLELQNKILIPK
jgi:predicted NAD-dependent protein-ADP-ribosyltransferase YbiA (DUF1768 family)